MSTFNPLNCKRNYSATSNNMKLVHWPLVGGLYIWYSKEGTGRGLTVPNVTVHPSTASVPITVLLCSFNACVKGLTNTVIKLHMATENIIALAVAGAS